MNSEEEAVQRGIRLISDECDEQMRLMDVVLNMTVSSASMERLKKLHDILTTAYSLSRSRELSGVPVEATSSIVVLTAWVEMQMLMRTRLYEAMKQTPELVPLFEERGALLVGSEEEWVSAVSRLLVTGDDPLSNLEGYLQYLED